MLVLHQACESILRQAVNLTWLQSSHIGSAAFFIQEGEFAEQRARLDFCQCDAPLIAVVVFNFGTA